MDPSLLPPEVAASIRLGNFLYHNSRMAAANHFPHPQQSAPLTVKTETTDMSEAIGGMVDSAVGGQNISPPGGVAGYLHASTGYPHHRNGDFHLGSGMLTLKK